MERIRVLIVDDQILVALANLSRSEGDQDLIVS